MRYKKVEHVFQQVIDNKLQNKFKNRNDLEKIFNNNQFSDWLDNISVEVLNEITKNNEKYIYRYKKEHNKFNERLYKYWEYPLDLLQLQLLFSIEWGDINATELYNINEKERVEKDFLLLRFHGHGCRITSEVISLLINGYSDGALSRWRSLHEVDVITQFIFMNDNKLSQRFLDYEIVSSHRDMLEYQKYCNKLNYKPFTPEQVKEMETMYINTCKKYDASFDKLNGWSANIISKKRIYFSDIEKAVSLDHYRPYYSMASYQIHSNIRSFMKNLGSMNSSNRIILTGPSNSGLTDPGHLTSITINRINSVLLSPRINIKKIIMMNTLNLLQKEIGEAFLKIHVYQEEMEKLEN